MTSRVADLLGVASPPHREVGLVERKQLGDPGGFLVADGAEFATNRYADLVVA